MLSITRGGVALFKQCSSLMDWAMRNSASPTSRLPLLFSRRSLLQVSQLILHISLGQSILTASMALLESAPCSVIPMLWATLFLQTHGCSPSKSMRSWYGWLGISS